MSQPSSNVIIVGPDHAWGELDQVGRRLQSQLLDEHQRLGGLVDVLLAGAPRSASSQLDKAHETLRDVIDQSRRTYFETRSEALSAAERSLDCYIELVGDLHDSAEGVPILVPDTNALLWNPSLDSWRFEGARRFSMVLIATVLSELDKLKIQYRDADVRRKVESIIGRLKDYRSRGDILRGVPLRRDISTVRMGAREPQMTNTLPWLEPDVPDDRIVATVVELMRDHSRTPVILVTRDINLQNKAQYAGIPFIEPPDPD